MAQEPYIEPPPERISRCKNIVIKKNLLTKLDSQNIISIFASSSYVISNALRTLNSIDRKVYLIFVIC